MKGKLPTYTYKLEPGITSDKHGMIIINNEKIIEIIKREEYVVAWVDFKLELLGVRGK